MDIALGRGNWDDLRFESADPVVLFSPAYSFVFLEGGDSNADELEGFLTANQTAIEEGSIWVAPCS